MGGAEATPPEGKGAPTTPGPKVQGGVGHVGKAPSPENDEVREGGREEAGRAVDDDGGAESTKRTGGRISGKCRRRNSSCCASEAEIHWPP